MAKKIHRYVAGTGGSSRKVETVEVNKRTHEERVIASAEQKNALVRGADYLLSRVSFSKYRYEKWSHVKRVVLGYLLWLIALPVLPLVLMALMRAKNPDNFGKSPAFALLFLLSIAWVTVWLWFLNGQLAATPADAPAAIFPVSVHE